MNQQESWGKGLVILTIIIVTIITVTFFTRLTAEAKHSYHVQIKAKEEALKRTKLKEKAEKEKLSQAKIKEQQQAVSNDSQKMWLTLEQGKKADALMKRSDCISCHNPAAPSIIAPQFNTIAKRYKNADKKVIAQLVAKIRKGGNGNWQPKYVGIMTPHTQFLDNGEKMTDEHIELMVKRILDSK